MLTPSNLKELFRLHRVSVMKQRRKGREQQSQLPSPNIEAVRHAEWKAADYRQQLMNEKNHVLNQKHLTAQERIADALEKLIASKA